MDTDLIALAGALEASGIEFVVVAAGETSLRETLQNLIVALTNTAAPDHGLIESIAQRLGVKISASTRRTPLHDNLAVRFSDPQLRIESQSTNGEAVATLFMLHNNNVYTWYGPVSAKFPGSPVKLVTSGLGIAGTSSLHVSAVGSLGSFLKECVRVHKDNLKSQHSAPMLPHLSLRSRQPHQALLLSTHRSPRTQLSMTGTTIPAPT